jgi:hypothetical protein
MQLICFVRPIDYSDGLIALSPYHIPADTSWHVSSQSESRKFTDFPAHSSSQGVSEKLILSRGD